MKIVLLMGMLNIYVSDIVICSFPKSELKSFIQNQVYRPTSLNKEGFVHCCTKEQFSYVAEKFFIENEQVLLISDAQTLGEDLIYEGERKFPHLYREFRAKDLLEIFIVKREDDGSFYLPKELK